MFYNLDFIAPLSMCPFLTGAVPVRSEGIPPCLIWLPPCARVRRCRASAGALYQGA